MRKEGAGVARTARQRYDAGKEAAMIELTEEQVKALEAQKGPLHVLNPRTQEVFVLIREDVYKLTCSIVSGPNRRGWDDPELDGYEQYRKKP
jgi:hypothetical protein